MFCVIIIVFRICMPFKLRSNHSDSEFRTWFIRMCHTYANLMQQTEGSAELIFVMIVFVCYYAKRE